MIIERKEQFQNKFPLVNRLSLIVPVTTAVILSVGYDIVSWILVEETANADSNVIIRDMLISNVILVAGLSLAVWVAHQVLRRVVKTELAEPLQKLSEGMQQIRKGNLDYQIPYQEAESHYEIYEDFNEMATENHRMYVKTMEIDQGRREFLLNVSHDMRSPLTSIIAYVHGLLDGVARTPEDQKRYLNTIKEKAVDMEKMVNRLFLYAQLDTGNYCGEPEWMDVSEEIGDLATAIREEYRERGLDIRTSRLDAGMIFADVEIFGRICTNLIENSCKYKINGHGILDISVREEKNNMKIIFADDGPGVPKEALPYIWNIFYRGDQARTNPHAGSGIGLAIVKGAVENMGGKVTAKNRKEGGLAISIRIPRQGGSHG